MQSTGTATEHPPLVGHSTEWTRIRTAVESAIDGTGTTVLLEGRPGSGKTHVLRAIEQLSRADGRTAIVIRCSNLAGDRVAGPVIDGLTFGSMIQGTQVVRPDVEGLAAMFAELARSEPIIVTVDDFQDADLGTQQVLFALHRLAEVLPIAMVVAATDWPAAAGRLVESVREQVVLQPLDEDDMARLVTDALGHTPGPLLTDLLRSTGGNPLLSLRLIEALETEGRLCHGEVDATELPAGFCRVVERFIGNVSDDARVLLRAAAVLGPAFRIDRVAAMLGRSLSDLIRPIDDLERAGVLQDEADGHLSFVQPVVRDAIHRSLNAAERLELTACAARELERDDDRRALELFGHVCGGAASAKGGSNTSAHLRTLVRSGRFGDAEAVVGATMATAGEEDVGDLRADLTEIRYQRARWNELIADIEPWLANRPGTVESDRLTANLAAAHAGLGHTDDAVDHAHGVLERQGAAGDPIARSIAYQVLATAVAGNTDADDVVDLAHRAVWEAMRMGTWDAYRRHPHTTYAMALADAGRPDGALVVLTEGRALADRLTTAWDDSAYCATSAIITARLGRWQETEEHVGRGLEAVAQSGAVGPGVDLHATRMVVALGRGDLDAATSALDATAHLLGDRPARTVPGLCRSWGSLLEARGDLAGARARLLDVWEAKPASLWINAGPALIRLVQQTDGVSSPVATEVATAVAERASATGAPWIAAYAARCEALVAQDSGRLRAAADRFAELGGLPDELECLVDAIRLAPTPEESDALKVRAQERCAALGGGERIAGTQRRVPPESARPARRRAARPVSGWGSLTVAEERVARLVAKGHTNAEAGAELFVSARTVESHLRRIFSKLEIRKRVELAVLVSQLDDQ